MAKILVIDDVPAVRMTIEATLDFMGHETVEAGNGREGIELLKEGGFDLIITDVLMPEMDGAETVEIIKEMSNPPPVLVISGGGREFSVDQALSASKERADQFLRKPFTSDELRQAIEDLLEKKSV